MDNGTSNESHGENSDTYDELAEIIKFLKNYKDPSVKKRKIDGSIKTVTNKLANMKKNTIVDKSSKLQPVIHLLKSKQKSKVNLRKRPFNAAIKRGASIALLSDDEEISEPDSPKPKRILRSQANNLPEEPQETKRILRSSKRLDNSDDKAPEKPLETIEDEPMIDSELEPTCENEAEKVLPLPEPKVESNPNILDDGDDLERLMIYLDGPVKTETVVETTPEQPEIVIEQPEETTVPVVIPPVGPAINLGIFTPSEPLSEEIKQDLLKAEEAELFSINTINTLATELELAPSKEEVLGGSGSITKKDYELLDQLAQSDLSQLLLQASQGSAVNSEAKPMTESAPTTNSAEPFQCQTCPSSFKTFSKFSMHMRKEHEVVVFEYSCNECEFKTNTKSKFVAHRKTHSTLLNFECDECKQRFATKVALTRHAKVHFVSKFACEQCDKVFPKELSLKVHKVRMHKEKKTTPPNASSVSEENLPETPLVSDTEVDEIKKPSLKLKKCNVCNTWVTNLADHSHADSDLQSSIPEKLPIVDDMLPDLNADVEPEDPPVVLQEDIEMKSESSTSDNLSSEKSNESSTSSSINNFNPESPSSDFTLPSVPSSEKSPDKIYRCPYCEKTFATSTGFKRHLTIHNNPDGAMSVPKSKFHKCNESMCDATFTTLAQLKKHAKTHEKKGYIKCPLCDEECKDIHELITHQIQTHSKGNTI